MLGMGDDGHTASLFPETKGLTIQDRLVIANEVPQKHTWRMTFTFPLINRAKLAVFYVLGESKKERLKAVLTETRRRQPDRRNRIRLASSGSRLSSRSGQPTI